MSELTSRFEAIVVSHNASLEPMHKAMFWKHTATVQRELVEHLGFPHDTCGARALVQWGYIRPFFAVRATGK